MLPRADTLLISGSNYFMTAHTLRAYVDTTARYLKSLRDIHEMFNRMAVLGRDRFEILQNDLSDLSEKITNSVLRGRATDFVPPVVEGEISPEATNRLGFSVEYYSVDDRWRSGSEVDPGSVRIAIKGISASSEPNCNIVLSIPAAAQKLLSAAELKAILELTASAWNLSVASVRTLEFEAAIKLEGDLYSGQWMTYFRRSSLHACLPRFVQWRSIAEGICIEVTPHLPLSSNPNDVGAAVRMRTVLDQLGLVWQSTYAIHGWPPDEEEWRYEEFISGAPRGRKYRVRCIDFDGYDSTRNVLLYAKLFRRLRHQRKEWGLRGWDGPVLNEAKRQVRAANGTQIEWHVGLEEPAARVKTLLADYTDFTDSQLKVIYTPLSQALA